MKKEDGEIGDSETEDPQDYDNLPYAMQMKSLKASFKAVVEDSDSEDDGLLTRKEKTAQDKAQEDEEYKAWLKGNKEELSDKETEQDLKPLQTYWSKPDLDPNEQFLRDYILNRRYLEEGEEAEDDGVSEDGELLEMQEKFETDYNMRFENENTEVKRYPRVIDGSLRRTDDRRKQKRKERNERKKLEKEKKKDDIAKNQKLKLMEFREQVEKIKKLTGNDQLGFKDEEIFGDDEFNPEEHDRKMQELYSDAFYSAEGGADEKPVFENEEYVGGWEDDGDMAGDPDNMDLEAAGSSSKPSKKESRSKKKRKEKKKKAFTDIMDIAKPVFDPNVHNSYQKYIDEYYEMDCEDFIDDIPCKFKYRQTVPNDYGLTVEEILAADDKELNQWVSAKKITKLRPDHVEKNEVKIYKQKAKDFALKKKVLASIYGSPKRDEEEEDAVEEERESGATKQDKKRKHSSIGETEISSEQNGDQSEDQNVPKKKKKKNKVNEGSAVQNQTSTKEKRKQNLTKTQNQQNGFSKKRKFSKGGKNRQKGDGKKNSDPMPTVSNTRLMAYDINPTKLKKKLKYKK
ncbi:hypothetical protein GE061_018602 [Apolygus lucorum]|uniref:Protein KRI1 homolog n=1 Tax=Apolygus lucorum TaxID=248454 RepID=A0A6A4JIJ1_APOLU|nr:hypothetical protein GE061_018602 [Apolygus lucorum]